MAWGIRRLIVANGKPDIAYTLNWNAASLNLPPGHTLTRAGTNATFFNISGVLTSAAANAPRLSYHPLTLALRGLTVEPVAATNICPRSTKMADVTVWSTNFTTTTADQSAYLDGTSTMAAMMPTNVLGSASPYFYEYTNPGLTVVANTEYVVSVDVKRKAGTMGLRVWWVTSGFGSGVRADFDITGVTASAITTVGTGSSTSTPRIENQGGGIYRISMSGKLDAASVAGFLLVEATKAYQDGTAYTPNGTDGFFTAGAQVETGIVPSSRIVTAAAAATRNADVLTAPTAGLLVNATGFAAMSFETITAPSSAALLSSYAAAGGAPLIQAGIPGLYDGTTNRTFGFSAFALNTNYSYVTTWGGVTANGGLNGVVGTPATFDGSMDLSATLRIGEHVGGLSEPMSIYLKTLRLGYQKLSDAEIGGL